MTTSRIERSWWSSVAMFLIHGLVVATWVSRIPAIQTALHLSNGTLGLALLGSAVGSVTAIPCCGYLVTRFGSKIITTWSTFGFCFSPVAIAFAGDGPTLFLALLLYGALAGTMDVAMNVQGVEVERALGKPTMSRFHAMFSLGGMAGAAVGGVVAAGGVEPVRHFVVAGAVCFLLSVCFVRGMVSGPAAAVEQAGPAPYASRAAGDLRYRILPAGLRRGDGRLDRGLPAPDAGRGTGDGGGRILGFLGRDGDIPDAGRCNHAAAGAGAYGFGREV